MSEQPNTAIKFEEVEIGQSKSMPSKLVIYGVPKIGKSRLAAQFPDPFFLDVEGGLSYLDRKVRATPRLTDYDSLIAWLKHIRTSDFKCGTLVIDSIDWVESLAQAKLCNLHRAKSINDTDCKAFAFNKGVEMAARDAISVIKWLDAIYLAKGIPSILIGHSEIRSIDIPNQDPFSRHQLKMSKGLAAKVTEWADAVLFCDYAFSVSNEGKTSEPRPVVRAGNSASYVGGGRMLISKDLPLKYEAIKEEMTK